MQVQDTNGDTLQPFASASGAGGNGMSVSCAWDPHCSGRVLTSSSDGSLSAVSLAEADASVLFSWQAHDYEAWIVTADQHMVRIIPQDRSIAPESQVLFVLTCH
jgi:hypothetical protein